jgi:hypothetical protein
MKRILLGLGGALVVSGSIFAQDRPSARLGIPVAPTVRAQSPELQPAAGFDIPKVMPKGAVAETPGTPPAPLPGSSTAVLPAPSSPPVVSHGPTISGPVLMDPTSPPIPHGTMIGGPIIGDPFMPPPTPGFGEDPSTWYVGVEALLWWVKSYSVPALVTTAPAGTGANLEVPGVAVLNGASEVDTNPRYGARITLGKWLTPCWAIELSGFYVRPEVNAFSISSVQVIDQDLARPFFSVNSQSESSEIVGRPGVASGGVNVTARSHLLGVELNGRRHWWGNAVNRLDFIVGARYLLLEEELDISEQTLGLAGAGPLAGVERLVNDNFKTTNQFLGGQIGAIFQHAEGPWTFEFRAKFAAGMTRQLIKINGSTVPVQGGAPPDGIGGLLALGSNIGERRRDVFAIVPEVALNVGYDITPRLRVFGGYSFMYWSNVARPGPQIDRALDVNQIPDFPPAPPAGTVRPIPQTESQSIWVQGVNFGFLFKW